MHQSSIRRPGRLFRFGIGTDGFDVEIQTDPDWREWALHVWLGRWGVHLFATPGRLSSRVLFDRIPKEGAA